jgi:DNA primase
MRFDERFLDEIKSRLRPSDVIGRTVKLRRQGREYVGLSPFSKEKSPSFYVNDDKGFYHDFSSGKHGDIISFLQETERLSFREAIEKLANEAGVALPSPDPREAEAEKRRLGLGEWLEEAAKWFETQLRRPQGDGARAYLDKRGLPESERGRFRLGYAPSGRTGLKDYLIAKGAQPKALVEAGVLIQPEDGGAPYDRFRDRIMFPITDARGRVISFGGRALDPTAKAKYLNGPETSLFHKGSNLYGLPEARKLLHAPGPGVEEPALIVVEGYMDAIACQRAGIPAVAPLGTALTEEQMGVLWRLAAEPVLCFDGDAAGQRAAHKVIDRALPLLKPGRSFRFALPAGGKDPDEVLREKGAAALKAQLAETRPLVEVLFEREKTAAEPLDTPERRTALKVALRKLAALIADTDLAQAYRDELLSRFEGLWPVNAPVNTRADAARAMRGERGARGAGGGWNRKPPPQGASPEGKAAAYKLATSLSPPVAAAVAAVLNDPSLADEQLEAIDVQGFGDVALSAFAREFISLRLTAPTLDSAGMRRHLAERGFEPTLDAIFKAAARSDAPFLKAGLPEGEARALWSQLFSVLIRLAALERALQDVKSEIDNNPNGFTEFYGLKSERDALRRDLGAGTVWAAAGSSIGGAHLH